MTPSKCEAIITRFRTKMTERANTTAQQTVSPEDKSLPENNTLIELAEGVFLTRGARRAAICDTNTGNVYSINESAVAVVLGEQENPEYWRQLKDLDLVSTVGGIKTAEIRKQEPKLDFVWFEIVSDDCNESCVHCYAESMPPAYRKALGLTNKTENESVAFDERPKLTSEEWKKLIQEGFDLGARRCQFIGGEPFVYHDGTKRVLDLAEYAKNAGYEFIEIFTNATLITPADLVKIKKLGLHVAVSLYSADPQVHDSITNLPRSQERTTTVLKRLKEAGIPTRVESVLMKQNQQTVPQTMIFIEEIGFEPHSPDVLRPKGRGDNPQIQPDDESLVRYGLMLGPNFSAPKEIFERYHDSHSCLAGKITITDRGDILPCIFSRDQITGNVRESGSLKAVIEDEKLVTVWKTTKDNVLVCQDCEYRYVCFDCRPLSQGTNNDNGEYKTAPYPRCTYNPYEGEWGEGTWKLDEQGNPYYDESLKPIIEMVRSEGSLGNQAKGH